MSVFSVYCLMQKKDPGLIKMNILAPKKTIFSQKGALPPFYPRRLLRLHEILWLEKCHVNIMLDLK